MKEIELKLKLTPDQYKFLLLSSHNSRPETIIQCHLYYNTFNNRILENQEMIRVTRSLSPEQQTLVTHKSGSKFENGVQTSNEKEFKILGVDSIDDTGPLPYISTLETVLISRDILKRGEKLVLINSVPLINIRIRFEEFGLLLELDQTLYSDRTDYELECEFDNSVESQVLSIQELKDWLTCNSETPVVYQTSGKFKRLLETL